MQLSREGKNSDHLGRYFTASIVSSLLIEAMGSASPKIVLDLGAGDGSLVEEAAKVWTNARFITVDVDTNAASSLLPTLKGSAFSHHTGDALDACLADQLQIGWREADAAICNPPYIHLKWKKQFAEILEDAGLSHVLPRLADTPADLLFIAQNLRLLCNDGRLGLILSDGIISGEKFSAFRTTLIEKHSIERIIELPRKIFQKTEAKSHIVVLAKNGKSCGNIIIQRLESNGALSEPLLIDKSSAVDRFDYSYLANNIEKVGLRKIGDETIAVLRGTYSSNERHSKSFPIFHTTDFSSKDEFVPKLFEISSESLVDGKCTVALPGDILVARVGRNLSEKICMVRSGQVIISDCLLLLRVKEKQRTAIFSFLRSRAGRSLLDAAAHGVCAKFITPKALLDLSF